MAPPLYEQLYTFVLDEIKQGRLRSGDPVPSEKDLAAQFNVSRITSKKALEKLAQEHLIERQRGRGSFVAPHLPDLLTTTAPQQRSTTRKGAAEPLIGLIVPDFDGSYGLDLVRAVEQRASAQQCHLLLKQTYGQIEQEQRAIQSLLQLGVDGLIVLPVHGEYYNGDIVRLVLDRFPLVLVDRYLKGIAACSVATDNFRAAQTLTSYLLDRGHQHIAFLSPPAENTSAIEERLQGFQAAFTQHGAPLQPDYCFTNIYSTLPTMARDDVLEADRAALRQLIDAHPQLTAFVACEHNIALMIAHVIHELGKRIPEDYSIVCFDAEQTTFEPSPFTHIQQDERAMGRTAVDLVLAQLHQEQVPLQTITGFTIIEGRSTAAPVARP